ncbi:Fe(2+) transporter permease subunit FeoB [Porticoccus sp. W117]|uniref:Fe(2+) transporter permease subunit FeoB n=1 Tax=Porticoccus sp. W117 TaxID=3054777 RepID=UPI00259521C1|nr:Fe(2+) transporter permease subunit FeoB [Porticoccus sp. W117]MDM3870389.1 Fe(2+) transporter permease subunit FeoB [Porticoccus sp. W117]
MKRAFTLALVGNPNCGKTTLFNALTGTHQKVGNWPGVTVEQKSGSFDHGDTSFDVVDLPGTYSLHVTHDSDSIDQQIAQQYVLDGSADLLVNIIDASSLERGLYLHTQLRDANVPCVIALNMIDVADQQGVHIDPYALAEKLGVPVVPIIASKQEGIGTLVDVIINKLRPAEQEATADANNDHIALETSLEVAIASIGRLLEQRQQSSNRLRITALLERDAHATAELPEDLSSAVETEINSLEQKHGTSASDLLIQARYQWIGEQVEGAQHRDGGNKLTFSDRLDKILLNRVLAFPIFLGVMYLMFLFTIHLGSAFIDFFDIAAGAIFVDLPRQLLTFLHLPEFLVTLVADGAGGGVQLVMSFVPVIGTLFLFQSFLESSGYMARAAFILDRMMRAIGLPGKSFVPLVVGFGCNVPSVMSARTLDSQQDRLLTALMAPFMSCGARLTVYVLFAAAFFPVQGQNIVFALYLIGLALAVLTGFLVRKRLMSRDMTPFIMELPNYHIPTLRGLLTSTWHRLKGFVLRAGKAIVAVVIVLNFLNSIGTDGSFGNQDSEKSVLSVIGMKITPAFAPMGVKEENWPATVGIFSGIFAKEVVVGTLDSLYTSMAGVDGDEDENSSFGEKLGEAVATIPANLSELGGAFGDPLGIQVDEMSDQAAAAAEQEVELGTLALMNQLFDGRIGAFAYILFVLLYMPCVATLGAIYKEAGGFWAGFSAIWNTAIAYTAAVLCYQLGTFSAHPTSSLIWSGGAALFMVASYLVLMHYAQKQTQSSNLIPVVNVR